MIRTGAAFCSAAPPTARTHSSLTQRACCADHVTARLCAVVASSCPGNASLISLREIIDALYGFPDTNPRGPTPRQILPPLLDTDTCSYNDMIKILRMCFSYMSLLCVVLVLFGDGQSVQMLRNTRRRWPRAYKRVLIGCGHFHQFAHWEFGQVEGFWACLMCCCMQEIGAVLPLPVCCLLLPIPLVATRYAGCGHPSHRSQEGGRGDQGPRE